MNRENFFERKINSLIIDVIKDFAPKTYAPGLSEYEVIAIEINSIFKSENIIMSKEDIIISSVINPNKIRRKINEKVEINIFDENDDLLCEVSANMEYISRIKKDKKYKIKYVNKNKNICI